METYINLGGGFIKGAGEALKAGYVITIDYGSNWEGILAQDFDHLRMYGQGSSTSQANPYHAPTLNDMTTDVNFSHLAEEGENSRTRVDLFRAAALAADRNSHRSRKGSRYPYPHSRRRIGVPTVGGLVL